MFDPEPTEQAVFDLVKASVADIPWKTISRKGRIFTEPGISDQPALYLIPMGFAITEDQTFNLQKFIFHYSVLVYTRTEESDEAPPQTLLNAVMKAVVRAIAGVPPGTKQTLGGLVENCWIEGDVPMGTGLLDPQCSLQIPIHAITGI